MPGTVFALSYVESTAHAWAHLTLINEGKHMSTKTKEILEEIYKGEKSAAETYRKALKEVAGQPGSDDLMTLQHDHIDALQRLGSHLNMRAEDIPEGSGAWGAWANTVMSTATLFGDKAALKALKEGEEHGLKQYRSAVDEAIDPQIRNLIRDTFIPRQEMHIRSLDQMIDRI